MTSTSNDVITGVQQHHDDVIATTLLNVTIMAADRRGGRRMLNVEDFNAFKSMLAASNGIRGVVEHEEQPREPEQPTTYQERPDAIQSGIDAVADAIRQATATLPPNVL